MVSVISHLFQSRPNGLKFEGVVVPWCNPLTLQPEQSGGVGSSPGRTPPLERRLDLLYFCDPSACAEKRNFTFTMVLERFLIT